MLEKVIVFVEEYSMEATLDLLFPKLLGDVPFEIFRFQCKNDLLKNLPARLRGYSSWLPDSWVILVLVDRDDDDCLLLKQSLEDEAAAAGLISKSTVGEDDKFQIINRIAIEELEAWFFGDWQAVHSAFPRVPVNISQKAPFRHPDAIAGGTWEALERILKKGGYFKSGLRKLELARSVGQYLDPKRNISPSFQAMARALTIAMERI